MPPFLPVLAISRSQNIRIGNAQSGSLGNHLLGELGDTVAGINPLPVYVDVGDPVSRRDLQRHSAIGGVIEVGNLGNVSSPYFWASAPAITAGAGLTINVASGTLVPRLYNAVVAGFVQTVQPSIVVAAVTNLAVPVASTPMDRTDLVVAVPSGAGFVYQIVAGTPVTAGTSGASTVPLVKANQIPVGYYTVLSGNVAGPVTSITNISPTS